MCCKIIPETGYPLVLTLLGTISVGISIFIIIYIYMYRNILLLSVRIGGKNYPKRNRGKILAKQREVRNEKFPTPHLS